MKLNLTRGRVGAGIATVSLAAAAVIGTGTNLSAHADPAAFSVTGLVLGVGQDETSRTLAWYSATKPAEGEAVELATKPDFSDSVLVPATLTPNTTTDAATSPAQALTSVNGKALLDDLAPETTYYYRVADKGSADRSTAYSFTTGSFGDGNFQFLFFGDPQIGSSGDPVADGRGWDFTLDQTRAQSPKAELYVSGGDQVNTANNETEWNNFLKPDELRSIPWAATIGNHDVGGYAYEQHFALPGTVDRSDAVYTDAAKKATISGGDYWYKWKGVLFIDLNSNAYSATNGSDPAHVAFVSKTIREQKDASIKHVVLVYHHAIYSPADHANDTDNQQRRKDFTQSFSDLGVDLVLQGHDHSYSRSYAIKGTADSPRGTKADPHEQPGQATVVEGPGGVVYVTANTASGSKYYDLTEPDATKDGYGADTLVGGPQSVQSGDHTKAHVRHWANSVESQEHLQTYIEVTVNDKGLQVKNIRANDGTGPNPAVDRAKITGIGPELGNWALPIGSIQDQVSIFRRAADISPILPPVDPEIRTHTVTKTETVTKTVTEEVVPAKVKASVAARIAELRARIKGAKGVKKAKLKAKLAAYVAVQDSLR